MASTVPAKSQPLHNFVLPHLWKNNHPRGRSSPSSSTATNDNNNQNKLSSTSPSRQSRSQSPLRHSNSPLRQSPLRQSPMREPLLRQSPLHGGDGGSDPETSVKCKTAVEGKRNAKTSSKHGVYSPDSHDRIAEKSEKKPKALDSDHMTSVIANSNNSKESRSKILIKIPTSLRKTDSHKDQEEVNQVTVEEQKVEGILPGGEDDEPVAKTWNLRPRKPIRKSLNVNGSGGGGGGGMKVGGAGGPLLEKKDQLPRDLLEKGGRVKVESEAIGSETKEKKVKFSVQLSRGEIEEDVYALTGSKPARRPKKRPKVVQKHLDNMFPGLWLASVTPESYKVSENYLKRMLVLAGVDRLMQDGGSSSGALARSLKLLTPNFGGVIWRYHHPHFEMG